MKRKGGSLRKKINKRRHKLPLISEIREVASDIKRIIREYYEHCTKFDNLD